MVDDAELLRRYAEAKDEAAFAELVRRHIDLVYAAALRRLNGDAHAAADVAQKAFTALAHSAARVARETHVAPWLYGVTRNIAVDHVRAERRRRVHEQAAELMSDDYATNAAADWTRLQPLLDAAMDALGERDRTAVVLRYFSRQPFAEVGRALGVSEDAARMRVERALERLRELLARRGVTSSAAALAVMLTGESAAAAPAGMAAIVAGTAVAASNVAGATVGPVLTWVQIMSMSKLSAALAGLALIAVFGVALSEVRAGRRSEAAVATARLENEALAGRLRLLRQQSDPANVVTQTAPTAAPRPTPSDAETRASVEAETNAYLARHPELHEALRQEVRATAAGRYAAFFRTHRLSPDQIERFLEIARPMFGMGYRFPGPDGADLQYSPTSAERQGVRRELQTLLGEQGFRDLLEYFEKADAVRLTAQLAGALYPSSTPLTLTQVDRLQQILRAREVRPNPTAPLSLDWEAVMSDATGILTEPQMKVLRYIRTQEEIYETLFTVP